MFSVSVQSNLVSIIEISCCPELETGFLGEELRFSVTVIVGVLGIESKRENLFDTGN